MRVTRITPVRLIISVLVICSLVTAQVSAYSLSTIQSFITGTPYYDAVAAAICQGVKSSSSGGPLKSGSKVYLLGDSITARSVSTYEQQFTAKGITSTISAVSGRAWNKAGNPAQGTHGTEGTGKEAAAADKAAINAADGIIIALGTNGTEEKNPIDEIINTIRQEDYNKTAPIWWVNVANGPPGNKDVVAFNTKLSAAETANKIKVIPWSKTVDPDGDGTNNPQTILDDATHPSIPAGVNQLVTQVVTAVSDNATGSTDVGANAAAIATAGGDCACKAGTNSELVGSENAEKAFHYMVSAGYTPEQAAGFVGNFVRESGVEPQIEEGRTAQTSRPIAEFLASGESKKTSGSPKGYGLVGWTGYSQLDNMAAWVTDNGGDPGSLQGQLSYLVYQLSVGGPRQAIGDAMRATKTAEEATIVFNVKYEVSGDSKNPGGKGWNLRNQYANDALAKYGGNASPTGGTTGACAPGGTTPGEYALPLDRKWYDEHKQWFTKPHHDYPASDIPVQTGTPVYSMSGGTITSAPNGGKCGTGVSIDAGNGIKFVYCHGSDGGSVPGASVGDVVKPGQLIMHSASTGNSSGPHLHVGLKINGTSHCPQNLFVGIAEGNIPDLNALPTSGCTN